MTEIETRIKNLENEIATLKSEKELQNRMEHIKNMARKRDVSREKEIDNLIGEYVDLKMSIDNLFDRMVNIIKVNDCLAENGYRKFRGCNKIDIIDRRNSYHHVEFGYSTNELSLFSGYVFVRIYNNDEIDLKIDNSFYAYLTEKSAYTDYSHEWKVEHANNDLNAMRKFLDNFDEFERRFYEYAENPTSVK